MKAKLFFLLIAVTINVAIYAGSFAGAKPVYTSQLCSDCERARERHIPCFHQHDVVNPFNDDYNERPHGCIYRNDYCKCCGRYIYNHYKNRDYSVGDLIPNGRDCNMLAYQGDKEKTERPVPERPCRPDSEKPCKPEKEKPEKEVKPQACFLCDCTRA